MVESWKDLVKIVIKDFDLDYVFRIRFKNENLEEFNFFYDLLNVILKEEKSISKTINDYYELSIMEKMLLKKKGENFSSLEELKFLFLLKKVIEVYYNKKNPKKIYDIFYYNEFLIFLNSNIISHALFNSVDLDKIEVCELRKISFFDFDYFIDDYVLNNKLKGFYRKHFLVKLLNTNVLDRSFFLDFKGLC